MALISSSPRPPGALDGLRLDGERARHSQMPARLPPSMSGVTIATRAWSGGRVNVESTLVRQSDACGAGSWWCLVVSPPTRSCLPEHIGMSAQRQQPRFFG